MRECDGTRAKVFARYGKCFRGSNYVVDYNNMKEMDLEGLSDKDVENAVGYIDSCTSIRLNGLWRWES